MAWDVSGARRSRVKAGDRVQPLRLPPAFVPRVPSAVSVASDYLRTLLLDGVLRPGDRLPLDAVAEALSLSRQPVREAIVGLETDGLVVTSPRRGTHVDRFDEEVIREHHELYGLLEARAVEELVRKLDPETLTRLRSAVRQTRHATDTESLVQASGDFRRLLATAASPRLRALLRSMTRFIPPAYYQERVPGGSALGRSMQQKILRAVERNDAEGAAAAVRELWQKAGDLVIAHLHDTGVLDSSDTGRSHTRV
jgi:DNA-binding GntR family transcriptional regulator